MTPGASLSAWITHKKVIHELASRRLSAKYKLFQKLVYGFYGVSLLLTLVTLLSPPFSPLYAGTVSASLGISASFGTLFLIFSGVMGYGGSAAAHEYMLSIFSTASHLHKQVLPAHEEFELLVDLGKEAIQSAADWVMIHR